MANKKSTGTHRRKSVSGALVLVIIGAVQLNYYDISITGMCADGECSDPAGQEQEL